MTAEYQVAVRTSEAAQAKAFAVSGVHYADRRAVRPDHPQRPARRQPLRQPVAVRQRAARPADDVRVGGRFSLVVVGDTWSGSGESRYQVRYGVLDESGKLNINALIALDTTGQVLYDALMKLPNMTEDVADAIVDWVDSDDDPRDGRGRVGVLPGAAAAVPGEERPAQQPRRAAAGPRRDLADALRQRPQPQRPARPRRGRRRRLRPRLVGVPDRATAASWTWTPTATRGSTSTTRDLTALSEELTAALGQEMSDYILAARLYGTSSTTQERDGVVQQHRHAPAPS